MYHAIGISRSNYESADRLSYISQKFKKTTYIYMFYSVIITGCTFHINKEHTALV